MTTRDRDAGLAADLEAARRRDARGPLFLLGLIVLIGALSVVNDVSSASAGEVPSLGRVTLGTLGSLAGIALRLQNRIGWLLAQWGAQGTDPGHLSSPQGVAVDAEGNVDVTDWMKSRVQKLPLSAGT